MFGYKLILVAKKVLDTGGEEVKEEGRRAPVRLVSYSSPERSTEVHRCSDGSSGSGRYETSPGDLRPDPRVLWGLWFTGNPRKTKTVSGVPYGPWELRVPRCKCVLPCSTVSPKTPLV